MKKINSKIILGSLLLVSVFSCKKGENVANPANISEEKIAATADSASAVSDQISSAASMQVKDKKFIKTANVNMEVKDVYDATISIEKSLKDLGGFVTSSQLHSNVISEETFNTSEENATLVKKYQTENTMQVRVPTEKLGDFLTFINDKKVFLNSRIITAEDVTNNAKIAEMETKKLEKTGKVIEKMKNNGEKVEKTEQNLSQNNSQQIENLNLADDLKYSTVEIYIKEPKIRIAEIAVTNSQNIDNKYKSNFFYEAKNALIEGFYLIQKLLVGLITIWPILLIGGAIFYFLRKRKALLKVEKPEVLE